MTIPGRFRNQCRLLRIATLVVFAGLFLLLALGMIGLPWQAAADMPSARDTRVLLSVVGFLPGLGYLWALWAVQRALGDLAAGRLFQPTVARAMRQIGIGVLAGALLNVFAVTNLSRWIVGGHGSYAYFDLSGIVLGVVGAALVLLAHLVDQARALQAELDEIL
ncbi:DUF2975 domain-containing protein [Thermomonas sp. HDW16]|uniref:DUF2975 domain-containing protein n=1 Tax=Thermomonas sp. HDW16 TaxID=2714945 RepID=UPI001407A8D4|nr:DUF2975 domain-containing protein [Thermomonas sp. HDW16]QIL20815.1 DUF2975 domain-containing protein [Thermomonas sp. HDW16]